MPMFWPGLLLSLVPAALLNRPVGRLLRAHWAVGFLLLLGLGGVITVALVPDAWQLSADAVRHCNVVGGRPRSPHELLTVRHVDLKVAVFVPIGLAAALAGTRPRAVVALVGAAALPFAVSAVQYAMPVIGQACDVQDVWDGVLGVGLGALAGLLAGPVLRATVRSVGAAR
ncbi:hypothetical protein F7Q99_04855 [Streptomyces kaniharaensis]|uniref:VanZ family protein n=1 Tax=Streptomyces kaniharaensis TaxID=212423 RepID=A0A6N7KNC4_9ACTN|nr:hypothetical protein [Streptomyces kaniharaensis]MQS11634.1 hypothetical protein [Streptomyces kaniharaensis]